MKYLFLILIFSFSLVNINTCKANASVKTNEKINNIAEKKIVPPTNENIEKIISFYNKISGKIDKIEKIKYIFIIAALLLSGIYFIWGLMTFLMILGIRGLNFPDLNYW